MSITGLTYIDNFISAEEHEYLINMVDDNQWDYSLKRRTQHYGYRYDYTKKTIDPSLKIGAIPSFLMMYGQKLFDLGLFKSLPDQVIVNEYFPGQGISPHIDCVPCFGEFIASVSLGSSCVMEFKKGSNVRSLLLSSNSLLVLSDEARYKWTHSIAPVKIDIWNGVEIPRTRRISLTFRNVILN